MLIRNAADRSSKRYLLKRLSIDRVLKWQVATFEIGYMAKNLEIVVGQRQKHPVKGDRKIATSAT